MQSPLVTRRHHDAEVEALSAEIISLVNELIAADHDLATTKQSLRVALEALKGANDRADYAFRLATDRFTFPVPLTDSMFRPSLHEYETKPWERPMRYREFHLRLDTLAFNFILKPFREDIPYVTEHVAAAFGKAYGIHVQKIVRDLLKKELK